MNEQSWDVLKMKQKTSESPLRPENMVRAVYFQTSFLMTKAQNPVGYYQTFIGKACLQNSGVNVPHPDHLY